MNCSKEKHLLKENQMLEWQVSTNLTINWLIPLYAQKDAYEIIALIFQKCSFVLWSSYKKGIGVFYAFNQKIANLFIYST